MKLIEWTDELSCGHDDFDDDHKHLFKLYNNLCEAFANDQDEDTDDLLEKLLSYASWHFSHEERVMQEYEYPDYFMHKTIHDDLNKESQELYNQFLDGDKGMPEKLLLFLRGWLLDHILDVDKKFSSFLAELEG